MGIYHHILLATDFDETCNQAAARATALAKVFDAKLSIVCVVEPIPAYGEISAIDMQELQMEHAQKEIEKWGNKFKVPEKNRHVELGSSKHEIVRIADEQKADLLVLGSHGRHGLSLILGSTANAVVHSAPCDVITVRPSSG